MPSLEQTGTAGNQVRRVEWAPWDSESLGTGYHFGLGCPRALRVCCRPSWHPCGICVTPPHTGKIGPHMPQYLARAWAAAGQRLLGRAGISSLRMLESLKSPGRAGDQQGPRGQAEEMVGRTREEKKRGLRGQAWQSVQTEEQRVTAAGYNGGCTGHREESWAPPREAPIPASTLPCFSSLSHLMCEAGGLVWRLHEVFFSNKTLFIESLWITLSVLEESGEL